MKEGPHERPSDRADAAKTGHLAGEDHGPTPHNRALVGDLFEEFHRGRSRAWYWRQTVLIVLRTLGREFVPGFLRVSGFISLLFLYLALINYAFWRLNRPAHLNDWVEVAVQVLGAGLMLIPAWNRPWSNRDWLRTRQMVLWIAFTCYSAWIDTRPLASRLRMFAIVVGIAWLGFTLLMLFGAARPRVVSLEAAAGGTSARGSKEEPHAGS